MQIKFADIASPPRVAVVYQQVAPPTFDGAKKDPKPGGYADSGADIAYGLRTLGVEVITPAEGPCLTTDVDWVFPDTAEGLNEAARRGATVIWANTVLFSGHPLEARLSDFWIVGQLPRRQQEGDDKFSTNVGLRNEGLPVAASMLVSHEPHGSIPGWSAVTEESLAARGLRFPVVVKPVRGRGSQGVSMVKDILQFRSALSSIFESGRFGSLAIVEEFLPGQELTVTAMAPASAGESNESNRPCVLPPVRRFNHENGVAPYNGVVAVTGNSSVLSKDELLDSKVAALMQACAGTFIEVGALAPIRIDCRADTQGDYKIFDVNMKPNMTGAGRPGREDQDSLTAIAARALGWSYPDLLVRMLQSAWRLDSGA
jgi:D-alanine-D-alanine ligase